MGGGSRITCSHGHPKHVNASPIHWFSFFIGVIMPLFLLFLGLLEWKAYPSTGTFPWLLFPLSFPRFSISLFHHGTSFIQLVGPYLHVTTWFIMRGNVKFFRPFLWALRKSCQPFWFYLPPLAWAWLLSLNPLGALHLEVPWPFHIHGFPLFWNERCSSPFVFP